MSSSLNPIIKKWNPDLWASKIPFGIGFQKPNNFKELFRAFSENLDNLPYAWRILNDGVCDGCALGTSGMHDWTIGGTHLCNIRLRLLRLNTAGAIDPEHFEDLEALQKLSSRELRDLGRIPFPLRKKKGENKFTRISWAEALDRIAKKLCETHPRRMGFYLTSRGIPNETYYAVQKAVRALGSNNIDNAARICHSPSTVALKEMIGVGATTCSYKDLIGTDLVVFFGSNPAVNQPVMMKYLYYAKKAGTKVVCVNPYREPAMEKYWIPSDPESALFGTKITDQFYQVLPGGDSAFISGVIKILASSGKLNHAFIQDHTFNFSAMLGSVEAMDFADLERESGLSQAHMQDFADTIAASPRAVLVWSMGITQHECGEDNVRAIVNLGLSQGYVGREGCGLMPIRGHSGVQGGAEMGAYATAFPGVLAINKENAETLSQQWGFEVPNKSGLSVSEMLDAANQGNLDVLWSIGGNFLEVLPDAVQVRTALESTSMRIHQDIVLSTQMLVEGNDVIILPATTRYEIPGGCTETSTERRVIFSPEIPGPRILEARWEGQVFGEIIGRICKPELKAKASFADTASVRKEIPTAVPFYRGIENLEKKGDVFQYGGPHLCADGIFSTENQKGNFSTLVLSPNHLQKNEFRLASRRGKQFNSMIHEAIDPVNGAPREAILINPLDARAMGLANGDAAELYNDNGTFSGKIFFADLAPRSLQAHWPECNHLLPKNKRSSGAKIPLYKDAFVQLRKK